MTYFPGLPSPAQIFSLTPWGPRSLGMCFPDWNWQRMACFSWWLHFLCLSFSLWLAAASVLGEVPVGYFWENNHPEILYVHVSCLTWPRTLYKDLFSIYTSCLSSSSSSVTSVKVYFLPGAMKLTLLPAPAILAFGQGSLLRACVSFSSLSSRICVSQNNTVANMLSHPKLLKLLRTQRQLWLRAREVGWLVQCQK